MAERPATLTQPWTRSFITDEAALSQPERTRCLVLYGFPAYNAEERAHRIKHDD